MTLAAILDRDGADSAELAGYLDRLSSRDRVAECVALPSARLKRLWHVASPAPSVHGDLLAAVGEGETAVFAGRNSLRALTRFEKHFTRQGSSVVGRNRLALDRLIGPGYFTVEPESGGARLHFDYDSGPRAGRLAAGDRQLGLLLGAGLRRAS